MASVQDYQAKLDQLAAALAQAIANNAPNLITNPELAEALVQQVDQLLENWETTTANAPPLPDGGLAALVGLGPNAADTIDVVDIRPNIETYDDTVTAERIQAVADLYYIYQHEKIAVFGAILKLQKLFRAGTVRLSDGDGAFELYQYDRKQVLRYTRRDRMRAYRRVFGYTRAEPPVGARPNHDFHGRLARFMTQVAQFHRDKRISRVIRQTATDPSFGSIAVVRRAGLDLRNNLKQASYGHINVLRVEVMQLLDEAFRILGTSDIRKLFGADNAWDVVEEILKRYFKRVKIDASPRSRMAETGRTVLRWLAQPHILERDRVQFEALLLQIADEAEEWLTSAEALGIVRPAPKRGPARNGKGQGREWEVAWEREWG